MKQRVISAAIGLCILFAVIAMYDTIAVNIAVAVIIVLALDELISATGYKENQLLKITALSFGALLPFFKTTMIVRWLPAILFCFALVMFAIMLRYHDVLRVEQVGFIFCFTIAIALSSSCLVFMRDIFGSVVGMYGIVLTLVGAWLSDTGAYFCGLAFGRHKLAPNISPKKTVEGAIGGVVVALISQLIAAVIYTKIMGSMGHLVQVRWFAVLLISPLISLISIMGDLSASVIKRQFGVKDFGKIMPGHGGVLDRFDSVLMVLPFVYNLFIYFPLIKVVG